jgi:NADH:ubiquinone oxidoreductase subunit 6 (subunit J)
MDIISVSGLIGLVFLFMIALTVGGAVIATTALRPTRSVSGLAICFIGVAGLYYFLNSPFVALMEIMIYVGAVCVVIAFGVMLADPRPERQKGKDNALVGPLSLGVASVITVALAALGCKAKWPKALVQINDGSVKDIGHSLLTNYSMVFELISVVLLVAIIGSLVVARAGRRQSS